MRLITLIAIILITMHFIIPSLYYARNIGWLRKKNNLGIDTNTIPRISIIIPTYNEAKAIIRKLNNIYSQDYPKDLVELIIIDSGSKDKTADLATSWCNEHEDIECRVINEGIRLGKAHALNKALNNATGDIVIITDADSLWDNDAIKNATKLLSYDCVGAVSCVKRPMGTNNVEATYRDYYNILRLGESRKYSTPIFHGELAAFKRDLLLKVGGFPTDIGADDSHTATLIAINGYRALIDDSIKCIESIPKSTQYHLWRIRRAQHLIQHFIKVVTQYLGKIPREFREIVYTEFILHVINPWLLITGLAILILAVFKGSITAITLLSLGAVLAIALPLFRTWLYTQFILAAAMIRNTWNRELIWEKQEK